MCVNTEWPGFFSHVLPILNEDQELDAESDHPGQHCFEKLTAGLYLGEVARRILLRSPPPPSPLPLCLWPTLAYESEGICRSLVAWSAHSYPAWMRAAYILL